MFVNPIHSLEKSRFGINLNIDDFKCKVDNKKENVIKEVKNKRVDNKPI